MSIVEAGKKLITSAELLERGNIGRCELIYGELVMMSPAGAEHGVVAMRIGTYVTHFVEEQELGLCFAAETGYLIETDPDLVRAPDGSFIAKASLRPKLPRGFYPGVPDLAVEVVSPGDTRREVAEKINMWLAHGTSVVWEAQPDTMQVIVHRTGQPAQILGTADMLVEESLLPRFAFPIAKIFKMP
jgi:Uma2 family endonuclease